MNEPSTELIAAELEASHHMAHDRLAAWFREDMARERARLSGLSMLTIRDFELGDDDDDD
jgi:hypothetical protein